jgi:uncharacterized ferritin-like protein (DUF455 family)
MELRDFAEQVLFATTVEEKLRCPETITDERPGSPLAAPAAPGRPAGLRFKPQVAGKSDFPGVHRLEQQHERGRLLHFFANHELLATELMALVLLRFPDAPPAFRKGVLQTLKDEQEHTRLYLQRMSECGIQFGELPVSGYFWRSVSSMENPLNYVSSLCLTFEQANLDFARHFVRGFATVGDNETARLLGRIYRDEIGHVAYGLKWFRRWKNPDESDWEAFCRQLKFPLSPQRAKGFTLNAEGRRLAGFDPQFIAELNVYSQSKGRTPSGFVFNPFAEGRIAEGKAFNPTRHQAQLARDLANLPQFLCRQDDIVLVEKRPPVEFLSDVKQAGFALPEFVELGPNGARLWSHTRQRHAKQTRGAAFGVAGTSAIQALASRKLGRLRPWAWAPDSMELLAPLFANVTVEKRSAHQRFNGNIAQLYSKAWSAELLRGLLACGNRDDGVHASTPSIVNRRSEIPNWLCAESEVGVAVDSLNAALEAIAAIRRRGHHKVVVKQSLGLAGSNAMRLFEPDLLETHRRWMANTLARGRQLVVEPWLEREMDFSVQLEMTSDGLKLCGYTGLINDRKGQFQANWAESHHHTRIPAKVVALFREPLDISGRLLRLYAEIVALLESKLRRADYLGPIGIDAFVYRTPSGDARLKPIVEINPRYTMGRLTVELMKRTCPGSSGLFRLVNRAMVRAEGFDDFPTYARSLIERFPLRLEGDPVPRIREGVLCLNNPADAQVCLAVFQVAEDLSRLNLGFARVPGYSRPERSSCPKPSISI